MLDFEHSALVGLIGKIDGFGHDSVEARAFKSLEPVECDFPVGGCRRDVDRRPGRFEERFQRGATLVKRLGAKIAIALAEQIKEDTRCRSFRGKQLYARGGGMNAQLKGIEVEPSFMGDDEFAVEHRLCGKLLAKWTDHLGEVSIEGLLIAALDEDLIAVAKDEYAKAIPLGLIDPFTLRGNFVDALSEHGKDGRIDGKVHGRGGCNGDRYTELQMPHSRCAVVRWCGSVG